PSSVSSSATRTSATTTARGRSGATWWTSPSSGAPRRDRSQRDLLRDSPSTGPFVALRLFVHIEAEHHSALVVLRDVTVRHPRPRIRDVQQNVNRFPGTHEHRVLPDEVLLVDPVAGKDEETPSSVNVERARHGVSGVELVDWAYLHPIADVKLPVDLRVLRTRLAVDDLPAHVRRCRHSGLLDHVVLPLDSLQRG